MTRKHHHGDEHEDQKIERDLRDIVEELREIEQDLHPKHSHFKSGKVVLMPKTIAVGETSNAALALVDQNGAPFLIDATYGVVYAASNPASVTIGTPNPDGSAVITGVAADPGNTIGATVQPPTAADGTVPAAVVLTPDTLVITGGPPPPPTPVLTSGAVVLS